MNFYSCSNWCDIKLTLNYILDTVLSSGLSAAFNGFYNLLEHQNLLIKWKENSALFLPQT